MVGAVREVVALVHVAAERGIEVVPSACGTWPLHTRPSVVIQTLCPSVPVNATTDGDWPVVLEAIVPFHTPGVVAATGVVGVTGEPVAG